MTAGSLPRCRWPIFHVQTSRSMHVCRCTEREPRPGVCAEWYNGGSACGQGRPQERRGSAAEPSRPAEGRLAGLFEQPSVLRKWEAYQVRPLSVSASQPLSPVSCCCYVHTYDGRFHTGCCMIEARSRRLSTFWVGINFVTQTGRWGGCNSTTGIYYTHPMAPGAGTWQGQLQLRRVYTYFTTCSSSLSVIYAT